MKQITYQIAMQATAYIEEGKTREITISFRAWKHGIVKQKNLLTDKTMVRVGSQNAGVFGETLFRNIKQMAIDDGIR